MSRKHVAVVLAVCALAVAPLTACSGNSVPGPDDTGPVKPTSAQASPQDLIVEILRLREQGTPEHAARYFISNDVPYDELDTMTEVDATILCTSNTVECDNAYSKYSGSDKCAEITSQEVQKAGVVVVDDVIEGEIAEVTGAPRCQFVVRQFGDQWWIVRG